MLSRARVLVLVAVVALGCGSEASPPVPAGTPGPTLPSDAGCVFVVTPHEALRADVERAAEHWSAATACEVTVGDGGLPVHLVASIVRPDGSQAPGKTTAARDLVEINVRLGSVQRYAAVLHELGHALGGDHTDTGGVLSGRKHRTNVIDAAALETVCSRLPCGALNPEEP